MNQIKYLVLLVMLMTSACDTSNIGQSTATQNNASNSQTDSDAVANPKIPIKVDLPIYLYGADSLIHPVVVSAVDEYVDKSGSFSKNEIYSAILVSNYQLKGSIFNIVFENKQTGQTKALFKNNTQMIHLVDYPVRVISDRKNATQTEVSLEHFYQDELKFYHHFIYQVQENLNKADSDSIQAQLSLYMSDDVGVGLKKLHPDNEYFIQSRWVADMERYYFTTKQDSNQDGKINLYDDSKTYYIDFKEDTPVVKSYDFIPK